MGTWEIILLIGMGMSIGLLLLVNVPGNFLLVGHAVWYGFITHFRKYDWNFILTLLLVAALVELAEYLVLAFGKKGYSANRILTIGAVLGGIGGAVIGLFYTPIVDSILGGIIGAILVTLFFELLVKKNSLKETQQTLIGLLIGRMGALTFKTIGTVAMTIMIAYKVL